MGKLTVCTSKPYLNFSRAIRTYLCGSKCDNAIYFTPQKIVIELVQEKKTTQLLLLLAASIALYLLSPQLGARMLFELVQARTTSVSNSSVAAALFACAGEEIINPAIFLFLHVLTLVIVLAMAAEVIYNRCRRTTRPTAPPPPVNNADFNLADALDETYNK
ncbi:E3 ORFA [Murine mastadenovirus A]|uniref:Early E3 17.7 kDa glycoprotein n=1 Tax=Murine adenovirus A serotype 1 TaxID=10530 RepID=E3GL_ADEM1|nr:putative E3 glycoprotein [Murine mastadenovirus A]AP_000358.1 E3 ORFA [Murine mastadenovirus A]P19720.1 RecName: Full=Early E3 17.7 kDa glycoprotein [Murine adenovirus 1]AAA42433.1 E3 glycoprotein (put.); putative [Murine adenovirus 1]